MDLIATGALFFSSFLRGQHTAPVQAGVAEVCSQSHGRTSWQLSLNASLPTPPTPGQLANWISGAVKHDTSVYDDWGPLSNKSSPTTKQHYAETFRPFEAWLEIAFPQVHGRLQKEVVNHHGLLYTWQGSAHDAKPLVLMAHQDVVPVEPTTVDSWVHEPFSGFIDETNQVVWGRGSSDDKSGLIGVLSALESLAADSTFAPRRTIIASFGFDEESSGSGAESLAGFLHARYGDDGVAFIVDEGDQVTGAHASPEEGGVGTAYAAVATAEKGYADVKVVVNTAGGHSSRPPKRTGIGLLSRIVAALEDDPPSSHLDSPDHPALARFLCLRDSPGMRKRSALQRALHKITTSHGQRLRSALSAFISSLDPEERYEFQTTQAVDIIQGGVKVNALPERSVATVNYRIDVTESVEQLKSSLAKIVQEQAKKLGLEYISWIDPAFPGTDTTESTTTAGSVHLEIVGPLEPAPHTPLVGESAAPWRLLSSVIQSVWRDESSDAEIPVVPSLMGGNTDTKSYWSLTRHIFRFSGGTMQELPRELQTINAGIHTVNEFVQIDAIVKANEFFTKLILAVQEW